MCIRDRYMGICFSKMGGNWCEWLVRPPTVDYIKYGTCVLCVLGICFLLWRRFSASRVMAHWDRIAAQKRRVRDESLQRTIPGANLESVKRESILRATVPQLRAMLLNDTITSEEILLTFYERAKTVGVQLEMAADFDIDVALTAARKADEERRKATDRNSLPPLHGIPISVKDCFTQAGLDSTCGFASRCFKPFQSDGALVEILRANGAIPFVRGSVPQGVFTIENMNNIFGRSKNPYNTLRTTGGSSGGDAGLVSISAAPFAIGTDVGGSLRAPALFCGVFAFKPTANRGTSLGVNYWTPTGKSSQPALKSSFGPIGRSVEDLVIGMRVLFSSYTYKRDLSIPPLPWSEENFKARSDKRRIGYVLGDDFLPISKANRRAVEEAAAGFKKLGFDVVEVKLPNLEQLTLCYFALVTSEGRMRTFKQGLLGERMMKEYELTKTLTHLPKWVRGLIPFFLRLKGENRLAKISGVTGEKTAAEYCDWAQVMQVEQDKFHKVWNDLQLDGLILPGLATPPFQHGKASSLVVTSLYAFITNLLDLPTGVFPMTTVRPGEDIYDNSDCPVNDKIKHDMAAAIRGTENLPVGVQIVTKPFEDEKCLQLMQELETIIKKIDPPRI
eukprot:TRINITY_DN3095_c0_g1_i3.p1 TRINITY_DN3095_c0_g1~~TRINITY_DN3095_c0_g1_i3.p1  ORF type:complete len:617 (+),score=159.16 TRINITY_DN3095_c0_g1_i3:67-1917(+)